MGVAEVVTWSSTKTTRLFTGRAAGQPAVEVREKVSVRTGRGRMLNVAALRDMVAALDEARIPGQAPVEVLMEEGRPVQLTVDTEVEPPPQTGPEAAEAGQEGGEPQ